VPVIDPQTHHLLAVADSPSGDLVQFDRSPNGSWAPYNLTNDVGRKTIVGNPVPIVDPQSNDLLVVARGTEGHLLQWDRVKTTFVWHVYDQTNNAGATIDGNPVPVVDPSDGDLLVFATGGGGHLLVFNRAAATFVWTYGDLTSITGARVVGVADPVVDPAFGYLLVFTDTPSEHLDMFLRTSNGTWAPFDLTSITSGPEIAATPAAFQNPANGDFDVFDASVGEHMVEFERQLTAVPPPVVVTVPPPKPTPHHHLRLVNVKVTFRWTIYFNRTLIHWVRFGRMSSRARVEFECRGRGCPWRKRTSTTRKLRRLKRAIDSRSFRPGDRLSITITEPGRVAERAELRFRAGARPSVGRL
jgi:hypothetical protein